MRELLLIICLLIPNLLWAANVTDNFNRSNADPIDGSWASAPWHTTNKINSNAAYSSQGPSVCTDWGISYHTTVMGLAQQAQVDLAGTISVWGYSGPMVRQSASGAYIALASPQDNYAEIDYLDSSGNFTTIANVCASGCTTTASLGWAAGDTLKLRAEGATLTAYRNGVSVLVTSDSQFNSGNVGIIAGCDGGVDNFAADDEFVTPPASATTVSVIVVE